MQFPHLRIWNQEVEPKWNVRSVQTASEMTFCVSGGALNSTHSLTHSVLYGVLQCLRTQHIGPMFGAYKEIQGARTGFQGPISRFPHLKFHTLKFKHWL